MNRYHVWIEGYAATGEHAPADYKGEWEGETFEEACFNMMKEQHWDIERYYNGDRNSFWGCKFYDNENDARKRFG